MSIPATQEPSEIARERETFRYDRTLIENALANNLGHTIPSNQLRTSKDTALTAFCQLAANRLNCARALISLFDRHSQFVVAESTQTSSLKPDAAALTEQEKLWLCGTFFPRASTICNRVLFTSTPASLGQTDGGPSPSAVPVTVIGDLASHTPQEDNPNCSTWPNNRFYAGVPLETPRGIRIGVLCVFDTQPRDSLAESSKCVLQELAPAIMTYLEGRRARDRYRQGDRVTRGIRTFFHGRASNTGPQSGDRPSTESTIETGTPIMTVGDDQVSQCDTKREYDSPAQPEPGLGLQTQFEPFRAACGTQSPTSTELFTPRAKGHSRVQQTLTRACTIFGNALELDGLLLLDASHSFSGDQKTGTSHLRTRSDDHSGSSDEEEIVQESDGGGAGPGAICSVLGAATSREVRRGGDSYFSHSILRERTLKKLLRYFPNGTIWNFDENGEMDSNDLSSDEASEGNCGDSSLNHANHNPNPPTLLTRKGRLKKLHVTHKLRQEILQLLPQARSVAFFPIWDAQKQRWFAGGFAYTAKPSRTLSIKAELSYLRAFGSVVMTEVSALKHQDVERSKLGVLNSISHELRSPLHGIILNTELMQESSLNYSQDDALRSIEACSRTLLDTIDQILDWTKINNFASLDNGNPTHANAAHHAHMPGSSQNNNKDKVGMMSITSQVNLATLVEDVIESVHTGHTFQKLSKPQATNISSRSSDNVKIIFNPLSSASWSFHVQAGAIRRIVMNIFGNSLKYTSQGAIYIQLEQLSITDDFSSSKSRLVRLTIADTGCGISQDYLAHDVFTPFSQEDSIESGTGLGLSVVKRLVRSLRGTIQIQSTVGVGTTFRVDLPLETCEEDADTVSESASIFLRRSLLNDQSPAIKINDVIGLKASLVGFQKSYHQGLSSTMLKSPLSEEESLSSTCREWLGLTIISASDHEMQPDIVICDESSIEEAIALTKDRKSTPLVVTCRSVVVARQLATKRGLNEASGFQRIYFTNRPIGPNKLARVISRWLQGSELQQQAQENLSAPLHNSLDGLFISARHQPITPPANEVERAFDVLHTSTQGNGLLRQPFPIRLLQSPSPTPLEKSDPFEAFTETAGEAFLLVDDNAINLKMLAMFIKKLGYPYDTAVNGQEALQCYERAPERYKCVFMDISMPVMNGFEATRAIRAIEASSNLPKCPILALTGLASKESQSEALICGIDLFLTKPIKLAELREILRERRLM